MVGDDIKNEILDLIKDRKFDFSFGLHPHKVELNKAIAICTKSLGLKPKFISFGHWDYTDEMLSICAKNDIEIDFSYSAYKKNDTYFFKQPFDAAGIKEYPVACDPRIPINPLTSYYHFFLAMVLITLLSFSNKMLHLTFHSYDLIEQGITAKVRLFILLNLPFIKYGL